MSYSGNSAPPLVPNQPMLGAVNTMQHLLAVQTNVLATPYPYAIKPPQAVQLPGLPQQGKEEEKTKKRKREDTSEVAFVQLPRDELLKMSSNELEEYIEKLKRVRPLTAAEHREVKRQRRLIKNREYAHTSRQKKKELVQNMKEDIDDVRYENESLHAQVKDLTEVIDTLKTRNTELEEENRKLKEALTQASDYSPRSPSPAGVSPQSPSASSVDESSSTSEFLFESQTPTLDESPVSMVDFEAQTFLVDDNPFKMEPSVDDNSLSNWFLPNSFTTSTASTGIFMLAIFFSFALFINPFSVGLGGTMSKSIPSGLAPMDQPFVDVSPTVHSTGRHLCEEDVLFPMNMVPIEQENTSQSACGHEQIVSMSDVLSDELVYSIPSNTSSFVDSFFGNGELQSYPSEFQSFPPRSSS